jgi:chromosome transmission fidelity protein 18
MEEDANNNEEKTIKPKKKDTDVVPLRRPIIFICNDIYAKALLPLKDFALNVKINEANPQRLIERLREICRLEKVNIDD